MNSLKTEILNTVGGVPDRLLNAFPDPTIPRHRGWREEYLATLASYAPESIARDGRPFFRLPGDAPAASVIERRGGREIVSYPSTYQAFNPELEREFQKYPANLTGYLNLWRHGDNPGRPLVLCLHGFMMGQPLRAAQIFKVPRMTALGLDAALYALPHHWRRRRGRQRLLNPDNVPLTLETMAQNVHDLHAAVLILRGMGYRRIGLIGASMGGLTASLYAAAADAPVDFMFMAVPAVTLENYLMPQGRYFEFGVDDEMRRATREALKLITPTELAPRFSPEKMAVVYHGGDRLCEARHTRAWIERWGIGNAVEVVGGHWLYLDRGARGRTWYEWLAKMGYI